MSPGRIFWTVVAAALLAAGSYWWPAGASDFATNHMTAALQARLNAIGLQTLGVVRMNDGEFLIVCLMMLLYGLAMGSVVHAILGSRAFGWKFDSVIALAGIVFALIGYALIIPYPDFGGLPIIAVSGAVTAAVMTALLCLAKMGVLIWFDETFTGARSRAGRSASAGIARLNQQRRSIRPLQGNLRPR